MSILVTLVFLVLVVLMVVFDIIGKKTREGSTYFRWAVVFFLIVTNPLFARLVS